MKIKNWLTQEYFNIYVELKQEIIKLNHYIKYRQGDVQMEAKLIEKIQELRSVLSILKLQGVDMIDLILLSLDIDTEDY